MPNKIHVIGIRRILITCSIINSNTPIMTAILRNGSIIFRIIPLIFILFLPPNIFLIRPISSAYKTLGLVIIRNHLIPIATYAISCMIEHLR